MKPKLITFSGFDDNTSIEGMEDLSRRYPVEWAVLFSPSRQGKDNRYPSMSAIRNLVHRNAGHHLRLAAHLCGDHSRAIMAGHTGQPVDMPISLDHFNRIQINHPDPVPALLHKFAADWLPRVIMQSKSITWPARWGTFDMLFDASRGQGIAPAAWPEHPGYYVGYAGGIGPDNVAAVINEIGANHAYWIDMESGVRTDDRFDIEKCRAVCEAVFGVAQ
jgi:hypothetical protein